MKNKLTKTEYAEAVKEGTRRAVIEFTKQHMIEYWNECWNQSEKLPFAYNAAEKDPGWKL